ncbi:conserved hypothetical protein [Leishmania major strain Friedlin]|uniref:Uncharacterized protein n=1 Tax=Leishmania major TaxID=5664 RepID=Q4QHG5_LEIMA|nr:conserved hypothetical protein [Leishmania major strain Friedlin]CAG9570030.1 hypothetical_protein_-_conserved [Leishmania major strain Friedlin]CAJ02617.1 conserved hypothetical protein [Leishmania major strain Friedlin]|eukprot:XP_001681383.1 conserved hypothetical protein [Leishmania major strain Friedlin]
MTPACIAITFTMTNVQQPSLYQTMQITLESNPLAQDPSITTSDLVLFVPAADIKQCVYSSTPTESTPGYHAVTATGSGGFTGQLILAVTSTEFTTGTTYYPCYLSRSEKSATIVRRGYVSPGSDDTLEVLPPIYTSFSMIPTSANGGEGPVSLSIVQAEHSDRPINQGLSGGHTILLVPCGSISVSGSTVQSNCDDLNALVTPCATVGAASATPAGVVALSSLQGQSTGKVSGNFTVPYEPDTSGYYMCVPYCYSASAGCGESTTAMSFTVVSSASADSSNYILTFGSADPGVYNRMPVLPQARENGLMHFTGAGLSESDAVKVIRAQDMCTSSTAALLPNLKVGALKLTATTDGMTTAQVLFLAPDLVKTQVVGRVCYQRAASGLWSTAYLSASNPEADFTIDILQPTGFELTSSSSSPAVGETLTLAFRGNGLDGSIDKAYLSSSSNGNPCNRDGSGSSSSSSSSGSDTYKRNMYFTCKMSGSSTTTSTCTVMVDPEDTNAAMTLSVCYLKGGSSGQTNFAQVDGTVALQARNPTYAVTPYPMFAGQSVKLAFTGVGLHADDEVRLIAPSGACDDSSSILATATIHSVEEIIQNVVYQYTLVGSAETCIMVCYRQLGSDMWVVARGADGRPAVSSVCAASNIYISAFPARYRIANLGTGGSDGSTAGTLLTVGETATVRFTITSAPRLSFTTTPTAIKVVQAADKCVTTPCGTENVAACARAQRTADYTGSITKTGSAAFTASIQVNGADANYIVCVETSSSSGAYVPVLPTSETSATSTAFGFTTTQQNPILVSHTPSTWRVAMSTLYTTFSGSNLDAKTNVVYAVAASALLALYTASEGTVVAVCPPVPQTPETVLVSAMVTDSSSSSSLTTATYTRADRLYDGQYVYLCYAWSAGNGDSHITMAGRVNVAAAIPSSYTWQAPTETSNLRAGQPIQLSFTSNLTSLSATKDTVYFYSYVQSSSPNPDCYCDPTACATGKRIVYTSNITVTSATTTIKDDTTVYTAPLGFSNYDYGAIYIICYAAFGQASDTYMGRVTVDLANPTYYTVSSVAAPLNRVGAPITITAVRRCMTAACALTLQDSLRLIPSSVQCSQLSSDSPSGSSSAAEGASVQAIHDPVLNPGAVSLARTFVVDAEGTYRVCYRLASGTTYSDVVFSTSYTRSLLTAVTANPQQATPVPSVPSAGQFVIMNLSCTVMSLCSTCTMLRLVPGVRASCWEKVSGTYSSDSCLTTTSVQYPDLYLVEGSYTVCYGSSYTTSRRVPGTLTVTSANPSNYAPTESSGYAVYTNQATDYTLDITGTELTTADTAFLLPDMGYTCHDLRTGEVQNQGELASWLQPSVKPYPLQLTSTGVSWVVSNQSKRFGGGLLNDIDLCPGNGAPCLLKLCYMRSGTSWAPVTLLAPSSLSSLSSRPPGIELFASNPSSVELDRYPLAIGMYVMATVQGAGLLSTDVVTINAGDCSGAATTVSVAGAVYVNAAGKQWYGVLRVTSAASSYAVCYWRSGSATEVATITFAGATNVSTILILSTPLYYVLSPSNFTSMHTPLTRYEELIVGASFTDQGTVGTALSYVQVITADTSVAECNYEPFQSVASGVTPFPVSLTLSSVPGSGASGSLPLYQGRLTVETGAYALCMDTTIGLFRVVKAPPSAAYTAAGSSEVLVYDAVPITYTAVPKSVMLGQVVALTFSSMPASSSDNEIDPAPAALEAGDSVQIIDGTLYECGFPNATVLAAGVVSASGSSIGSTTVSLALPTAYELDGVGVSARGKNHTVCYRKQKSTFATSPRIGSTVDRNFHIMVEVPTKWATQPQQAQVNAPLNITFYGDLAEEDFLTAADVAFLVSVPDGAEPDVSLCRVTADRSSIASASRIVISQGTMTKLDNVNTQWSVPANVLLESTYVVCYTAEKNGQPLYVSSPATLVVYPTQSPSGAYLARSATSVVNDLTALQGERVFLLFNTTVALDVVLDNGQSSSSSPSLENYDAVRITADSACSAPLGAGVIDPIPTDFGYAPPGIVDETTGLTVPYLNLRIRAEVGSYYVCMRRRNRESWQAYYEFEVVGGLYVCPAVLKISAAAVVAFTTMPTTPRAWVPHTEVQANYDAGFSMANVVQFFFVAYTGTGSVTDSDEINGDSCYRPASSSEALSASVTLVNRTLQVYLVDPMFTQHSFGMAGTYLLCYQITGRNIASIYPTALTVANPSPTAYIVPSLVTVQHAFTMSIVAMDAIFATGASNVAQIYTATDATVMPNCTEASVPSGGTTHFTKFTQTNVSYASVEPTLLAPGYYFLCFLTDGQKRDFVVPNAAGAYVFSVGLVGAQKYTVAPSPAYLGQLLDITITGSQLSSSDHVKLLRVSHDELSSSGGSYAAQCTPNSENADASEAAGAAGSTVQSSSGTVAHYHPRVNETGTFILCYQSSLLSNAWVWVMDIHQFTVSLAHPTHYSLSLATPYETQVLLLYIHDSGDDGSGTAGRLQNTDQLKLVDRGSGARGFDCAADAANSNIIGLISYVSAQSNSSVHVYQICGSTMASVTVCYALSGAAAASPSWAEVPLQSPPPTYIFEGVSIEADPFVGPLRGSSSSTSGTATGWVAPRPYEPFSFYFTTEAAGLEAQRVAFAQSPVTVCALDVSYVAPLLYEKVPERASEFTVSLPYAGSYAVYIGPYAAVTAPNIAHGTPLLVGQCDPCNFTPSYALVGTYVSLSFPSSVGDSLSDADEVRLFPVSQGLKGRPCEATTGAYAGVTLTPDSALSTSSMTVFNVTTGAEAEAKKYLGEYYVCYRKGSASSVNAGSSTATFAVVSKNDGTASIFSVYPADLLTATVCPASPMYALETAVFNVTARDTALYPNVAFSSSDVFVVVPSDVLSSTVGGGCGSITDVDALVAASGGRAQLAKLDTYGNGYSNWYLTFATQMTMMYHSWCFKMQYDTLFRNISSSLQTVLMENPYKVITTPPVILPTSSPVLIDIKGSEMRSTDQVYIVPANQSCSETCSRPLTPIEWPDVAHTTQYVNSTTTLVTFSNPINVAVSLGVCYRRTGRYLTRLAKITVMEPNPASYTVNFVPRVGTRPTLVFTGENLTGTDTIMIVEPGATCLEGNAVVAGTFVSVSEDATTSQFLLALVGHAVLAQSYTVCYEVSTVGAYVEVSPVLQVLEGGPSSVLSSNTPMRGRATVLTVADPQVGDEMYIACVGCSCFDEVEAVVPYGSVRATAHVREGSISSASDAASISLRVGFNDTKSYPVCYRRRDSGYAQIGGTAYFVTPVPNSPSAVAQLPALAQYQGQRLYYNFSDYTPAVPLGSGDLVMLVQAARACWDNVEMNASGVVVQTSELTGTIESLSIGRWEAHVPSLGPGVPSDTPTPFPLSYLLCYRQVAQLEYVSVPFEMQPTVMRAADPATFETKPKIVEKGMLDVNIKFGYTDTGKEGDEAYVVQFTILTNTVCDDARSTLVSARGRAHPMYILNMSGSAVVGESNTAVCYTRAGATVAEVPQLLTVAESNPSGYLTNVMAGSVARGRQYIEFVIVGSGLSVTSDEVVFTDVPCAMAPRPFQSSSHLARLGDAASNGTTYRVVAQFISLMSPIDVYVCYQHSAVWREVGAALTLNAPQPLTVLVISAGGTQTTPRAGQHLHLQLIDGMPTVPIGAAVLSAETTGTGTWCHNFTAANVQEPALDILSAAILDVSVWQVSGHARLCVRYDDGTPWADVATSVDATSIYINPANPSAMDVFPSPPRVGQSVTLTFRLLVPSNAGDMVKITAPTYEACEMAASINGFPPAMPVTVKDNAATTLTLVDSTDPLLYRSFNTTGTYRVCYYSAAEMSWGVVGGTLAAGSVMVEEPVPQSWVIASGHTEIGYEFALAFHDEFSVLKPSSGNDLVWAAPSSVSCGVNPYMCRGCIIFEWNASLSNSSTAVTAANASVRVDSMNLCYRLAEATAALVPGSLNITTGPIQCVEEDSFISGQQQLITFRLDAGTNVMDDSWRLSFYATTALHCNDRYLEDFVPGSARLQGVTSTSATYLVLWPVGLGVTTREYTICYTHNNLVGPVCTCGQIDANTGECYISGSPGSPQSFTPSPHPTYVGQTITLNFTVNASMTAYPPTAIKFVTYVDELTVCDGAPAFTPVGATLTKISALLYMYVFKHQYTLGTATLLVCALTDLSPSYGRVASVVVPSSPTTNNTLWIRPYLGLITFPSEADYLRSMQTLNLTFTMASRQEDDVVSKHDRITVVSDPHNCIESYISAQDPSTLMSMFYLPDTAFLTLPATVLSVSVSLFLTRSLATFAASAAGQGTHYFCYKLRDGTWAPILPKLTIQEALIGSCSVTGALSPSNGDNGGSSGSTTNNGGSLRAMYYAPTQILGTALFELLASPSADAVRVVPQSEWCTNDAAAVFTTAVASGSPSSLSRSSGGVEAVFFAPLRGAYKVCYRFGTSTNWSPACTDLSVTDPSPTGATTGCWNVGQTMNMTATHAISDYVFTASDHLRLVQGALPCRHSNGSLTVSSETVTVGDAVQPAYGILLSDVVAGQTTYMMSPAFFRTGTRDVRLCYTDAAGNQFAVPLDFVGDPGKSLFPVQARQPSSAAFSQRHIQVGQRLFMNFTSASSSVTPPLHPYAALPQLYTPGPAFNGTFDGATLLAVSSSTAYIDGRCAAALRAGTLATTSFLGVYGSAAQSGESYVPYTIGNYDPTVAQHYITCYQLATCGVVDSGDPFRVLNVNPSNVYTDVSTPRRGQLIKVLFTRDMAPSAVALTPGSDRGIKQPDLASCWTLTDISGQLVQGTADLTHFTTIFYAQAPELASTTATRSCYKLSEGSWSEVPNGEASVLAANPKSFATNPASVRVNQVNYIQFYGTGLGSNDRVKLITRSLNCSEDSVPPSSLTAYKATDPNSATAGTSEGWKVTEASSDGSTARLNFTSSSTGTLSVCYRLDADTVWTLVYGDLIIYERNPPVVTRTPVTTLEGELFTLNFTASTEGISDLSSDDRVVLYYGSAVNCIAPTTDETAPSVTASPSRTDMLPQSIAYQLDMGTRGNYTLCYKVSASNVPGGYVVVWGYDVVVVAPNPQNMTLYPVRAPSVHRPNELLTHVFAGWGLAATTEKMDSVKVIEASASGSTTDTMCQNSAAAAITYYPLYANGTHAEQVWRASPAGMHIPFSVCYKLYGGQYHVIGDTLTITGTASPSGATSAKLSGSSTTLSSGESMSWTLVDADAQSCADNRALLFFSANDCHAAPYYVNMSAILSSSALIAITFPAGAVIVSNCGGMTQLRVPWTYPFDAGLASAAASSPTALLSLCYWSAGNDAVSVLSSNAITLSQGVPPPLDITLSVMAQEVFSFSLSVSPATTDWVVLVVDPSSCVGVSAPANDADFTDLTYSETTGVATVTAAVPGAGMYYVCYSHQVGLCAASTGRECARVVAQVEATAASPQSWSGQPTPVYVSSLLAITLAFPSNGDASAQGTTASAWLAVMAAEESPHTMRDVWVACVQSQTMKSLRYGLTYSSASGMWNTDRILVRSGPYALCYTAQSTVEAALHLFGPARNAGPVVLASTVTGVDLPPSMTVTNVNTVVLTGGGLSTTDVVMAVALPSSSVPGLESAVTEVPSDICTNEAYKPRVNSTNPSPAKNTGMTSMLRELVFSTTGDYVLCYTATYGLTTSDSDPSNDSESVTGTPVLITPKTFTVSPSVISMTVVSLVLEVGVELHIVFTGSGLMVSDMAALVYVGSIEGSPTVPTVCLGESVIYENMVSVNADGTNANYKTTPVQQGVHMVCFRKSLATTPILMPTQLCVGVRTAVQAVFKVQPGGCIALLVCTVQPTIMLLSASGLATSAPHSSVSMLLYLSDGTTPAPAGQLSGGTVYSHVSFTNFTFWALRVSTAGSYVMKASVTLPGGGTLVATSSALKVAGGGEPVVDVAAVSCLPIGILDRTVGSTTDTVDCLITALTSDAPNNFTVLVNAGMVSIVTRNGTTSSGLSTYSFTVTAPATSSSATGIVNYLSILVTPIPPYETLPVQNSPMTVRLATSPSALTTIGCSAGATQLPLSNMVRVGGILMCYVQGIATIHGQAREIVARPEDLKVSNYYNGDVSTSAAVNLGAYPLDVNGRYNFTVTPTTGLSISVAGTVFARDDAGSPSSGATSAWATMANSPQSFILIGVPTAAASRLMCTSTRTGSMTWYTPTEPLQCTATLANAQGPVNGLQSEYSVLLPDGGSVSGFDESAWGVSLVWKLAAPPPPSSSSLVSSLKPVQQHAYAARAMIDTFAAAVRQGFSVQVRYTPSITVIATYAGGLVYVTSVVKTVPRLKQGATVSVTFAGIGLVTMHRYTLGAISNCSSVLSEARSTEGSAAGELVLTFEVPSSVFIICFSPQDARTALQPLLTTQWTPESGGPSPSRWTGDDLVLLIVGVAVLFILVVLLVILLWCIFCGREEESEDNIVDEEHIMHHAPARITTIACKAGGSGHNVYMPPRANNRYVLRIADESPPAALPSPAPLPIVTSSTPPPPLSSPPVAPPQQQHPQQHPSSNTQIRINIHDGDDAGNASPRAPRSQATTPAAATSVTYAGGSGSAPPPATMRKRHHHCSRRSSSTSSDHRPHQQHQSNFKYADLDRAAPRQPSDSSSFTETSATEIRHSVPPLPPPPLSSVTTLNTTVPAPSANSGLVESPRQAVSTPTADRVPKNLPPLPPPPPPTISLASPMAAQAPTSGPYEHLHRTTSGMTVPGTVDAFGTGLGSLGPCRSDNGATEVLEPITVVGHTSKPMVRSASSPR